MLIEQAKELLEKGEYLTHRFFEPHEFIKKVDGVLMDESELTLNEKEFWDVRRTKYWKQDWEVYEW